MADEKEKIRILKVSVVVLTVLLVGVFLMYVSGFGYQHNAVSPIKAKQVSEKILNKLVPPQFNYSIDSIELKGSVYEINLSIEANGKSQNFASYLTLDGEYFFPQGFLVSDLINETEETSEGYEKTEKPEVKFFVMSFCPFGRQAEKALSPVARLLEGKAVFEPVFIVRVVNDTVYSLHGSLEAQEDMRQACIYKYYPEKFWDYLDYVNYNCSLQTINSCWKEAAEAVGVNESKIEACVDEEGVQLMKEDEQLTNIYEVSGSPTVFINDKLYSGSRTSEAYKQAVCSAFINPPEECSTQLSSSSSGPAGVC